MAKQIISKIILIILILAVVLTPFNRGLQLQKTNASWLSEALDQFNPENIVHVTFDAEKFMQDCLAQGVPQAQCEEARDKIQSDADTKNEQGDNVSMCKEIVPGDLEFICDLSAPELAVGALTTFYLAVCLPITQVPASVAAGAGAEAGVVVASVDYKLGPVVLNVATICDSIKKALSNFLKTELLGKLQNDILDWIERDGKGPVIVNNWGEFLTQAGKNAVGDLVQEIGFGYLCRPFQLQIQITLPDTPRAPARRVTCTLDDIVSNIQNFYNDFRQGGFIAYQTSWQPQNNIFGVALLAVDEAAKRENAAKNASEKEAQSGFLSKKTCVTVTLPNGKTTENCTTTSPGSLVGNAAAGALVQTPLGSVLNQEELGGFLGTIIDAAINQILKNGINKLKEGLQRR